MKKVEIKSRCIPYRPRSKNYLGAFASSYGAGGGNANAHGLFNYLPATRNGDGSYVVTLPKVYFTGHVIAGGEVTAYGTGNETEEGQGGKIIVDTALSPTSENPVQNKVIYTIIGDMSRLSTTAKGSLVDAINEAATKGGSGGVNAEALWQLLGGATTEQINKSHLTDALKDFGTHKHDNLDVLNKITQNNYDSWVKVVNDWNTSFYFDESGNLRARLNLIGNKEVAAFGPGESSPSTGIVTIVDNLTSTSADAALSANQGRILKNMIDNKVADVDLTGYATQTWVEAKNYITSASLNGYATQTWVRQQGYLTQHQSLANYPTRSEAWLTTDFDISDYAEKSEAWLTSDFSIYDYAKKTDLNNYAKKSDLNNYVTTNTAQTISGKKTFTSAVSVSYDNMSLNIELYSYTAWFNTEALIFGFNKGASFDGGITATGEVTAYSDARLKSNVKTLDNRGYIRPVSYIKDGKESIGFLAQEVRKLYPELVRESNTKEKYLSMNYAQYTAVLQAQIIELEKRLDKLERHDNR